MNKEELRIDFSTSRGHEMIIDRGSGILREELDEIEIQMLQGQQIAKLLPINWVDIDGKVNFRFSLSGRRMLTHKLQIQQLSMPEFYSLLLAVVETLDDSYHYMLRPEGFLLSDPYIFVGESWSDIGLAYIPLREIKSSQPAGEALLTLAVKWIGYVHQPDGSGLQLILQYLREEHVSWNRLRQAIHAMLGTIYSAEKMEQNPYSVSIDSENSKSFSKKDSSNENIPLENAVPTGEKPFRNANDVNWNIEEELPLHELDDADVDKNRSRKRWIVATVWIVLVGIIWRYVYMPSPTQASFLISTGLTVVAIAGLLIYRKYKHGNSEELEEDRRLELKWNEVEDEFAPDSGPLSRKIKQAATFISDPESDHQLSNAVYKAPAPAVQDFGLSREIERKAKNIEQHEATILLGQDPIISEDGIESHWLEREAEGDIDKIILQEQNFIIGRSNEGVNYVDNSTGISRAHLELSLSEGSWSARDVGSRNGTTCNGIMMIPYKAYLLSNGDCIQLAGARGPKYIYKTQ